MLVIRIGLVMLQGARHVHISSLNKAARDSNIEIKVIQLRKSSDLLDGDIHAIIIPGGESTTMRLTGNSPDSLLLPSLLDWLRKRPNLPVLGTCAGAILLSDPQDKKESLIDATINRNAYGRQIDSFQADIQTPLLERTFPGVFIRAPKFNSDVSAEDIVAICEGEVVGVRKGNRLALTFHPELSEDVGFHRWLIERASTIVEAKNVS